MQVISLLTPVLIGVNSTFKTGMIIADVKGAGVNRILGMRTVKLVLSIYFFSSLRLLISAEECKRREK